MAEGSMHTQDSDAADDSRLSYSSPIHISDKDDMKLSDIMQQYHFEILSDTGHHYHIPETQMMKGKDSL